MSRTLTLILVSAMGLIISKNTSAQQSDSLPTIRDSDEFIAIKETEPKPPGGMQEFKQWIEENYNVPRAAKKAKVKGKLLATFVVEPDGKLTDIRVIKHLGHGTKKAAEKLFKKSPPWKPGMRNGEPIRMGYAMPIPLDYSSSNSVANRVDIK